MSRQVPSWDDIPQTRRTVPAGLYLCEVEALEEGRSREKSKLMYKASYQIVDGLHTGTPLYEYHNIGSDDDPNADDPLTWRNAIGTRTLRDLFTACAVPLLTDMDKMCVTARGQRFVQQVGVAIEPPKRRDGTPNQFAGRERNDLGPKYRLGTAPSAPDRTPDRTTVSQLLKRQAVDDE